MYFSSMLFLLTTTSLLNYRVFYKEALCILCSGVMEWSLGLEPRSGVLEWNLGVKCLSERETLTLVVKFVSFEQTQ